MVLGITCGFGGLRVCSDFRALGLNAFFGFCDFPVFRVGVGDLLFVFLGVWYDIQSFVRFVLGFDWFCIICFLFLVFVVI